MFLLDMLHENVQLINYMNTTYFFILGLSIFSLKGLSGLDILDEFESMTITIHQVLLCNTNHLLY